jgi:hypothetical protein
MIKFLLITLCTLTAATSMAQINGSVSIGPNDIIITNEDNSDSIVDSKAQPDPEVKLDTPVRIKGLSINNNT